MTSTAFLELLEKEDLDIEKINDTLLGELKNKNLKIATAESCTGGMVSKWITDIPGAATVFDGGVCAYANEIKVRLLGVKKETLANSGAVSHETAQEMANGIRLLTGADIAVSTTGIAGPDGGSRDKPVGLVYVGVSTKLKTTSHELFLGNEGKNKRNDIRKLSCAAALYLAYKEIII